MTGDSSFVNELRTIVGRDHLLVDADLRAAYEIDWTRRFHGEALAVARPRDVDETAAVLRRCAEAGIGVVPQGGNTGMVGAGVPRREPMVIVSTTRMIAEQPADTAAGQITLGAGVTIARWRAIARAAGLDAPVDFGARDTATVGGATATNAGGSRVVRFGTMRAQVMGLRAALGDGSVVGSLSGLPKETIGVHWPALMCGSEGTLGIITDVRLRLVPWFRRRAGVMLGVDLDTAPELLAAARQSLPHLDGAELLLAEAMDVAMAHLGRPAPIGPAEAYVILECAGHDEPTDVLTDFLATFLGGAGIDPDTALATDDQSIARLIEPRDRMPEALARLGVPLKLDVAVPPLRLAELVRMVRSVVAAHGCRFFGFGHLAEGNVHVNVFGPPGVTDRSRAADDSGASGIRGASGTAAAIEPSLAAALADEILGGTAALGGTISAEHGVGIAKARWLPLVRTRAELDALAGIKRVCDPHGVLNPGVLDPDHPT